MSLIKYEVVFSKFGGCGWFLLSDIYCLSALGINTYMPKLKENTIKLIVFMEISSTVKIVSKCQLLVRIDRYLF